MSTSDLRRGPGWWMDLDGSWKPPELWPESSPPLPGWVRLSDDTWHDPTSQATPDESDESAAPASRPVPDTATGAPAAAASVAQAPVAAPSPRTKAPAPTLQFSETQAVVQPNLEDDHVLERAIRAAIIAGILAVVIGIGLGLLLATL